MAKYNILEQLKTKCSFSEVFKDTEKAVDSVSDIPRKKIGHIRADYDGHCWWNTVWISHSEFITPAVSAEMEQLYNALTATEALPDFETLVHFCNSHPEARVHPSQDQEYNFYLESALCNYWVRLITRWRDYNIYLHAFAKD